MEQSNITAPTRKPYTIKRGVGFQEGQITIGAVDWSYQEPSMYQYLVAGAGQMVEDLTEMFDTLRAVKLQSQEDLYNNKWGNLSAIVNTEVKGALYHNDKGPAIILPSGRRVQ